jgi:hypothetical protein
MTDQPQTTEPVPVQLTRIEGTVNLIAYQMAEVKSEVAHLSTRVTAIELTQASASGSSSFLKAWLPLVVACIGVAAGLGFGVKWGG